MKKIAILGVCLLIRAGLLFAQAEPESESEIFQVSRETLAGVGLDPIKQKDSTRRFYQKNVYKGKDLLIYIVAIGSGITNEFNGFPMEEFIFWKNGKAVVEPEGQESFSIHSGDYFIQAKGFTGKWNFIGDGRLHLELAVIAANRPPSDPSPISKALVIERDVISGVTENEEKETEVLYEGVELTLKVRRSKETNLEKLAKETMMHVVNGVLVVTSEGGESTKFLPGDFFVLPEGFSGKLESASLQGLRILEVTRT